MVLPRTLSTASSCSSTILCIAQSGSAVGWTPTFFRSIRSFSMLKGACLELDPDTDCIGSVTVFEYVIPAGRIEAIETGAALLLGAHDGPPITVTGVGVGCSTTSSTCEVEEPASCQGFTKSHSGWVRMDSGRRDLKNILIANPPRTTLDPSWEASAW
jgi:hypothetical protein